jgi:hypothetical protein
MKNLGSMRFVVGLAWLCAVKASADTVTITPMRDNTLFEAVDGSLSNGAGPFLYAGRTSGGDHRRALLKFDVAGQIPSGATINSVQLTVYCSLAAIGNNPEPMTLHRLQADWGEGGSNAGSPGGSGAPAMMGDATWVHRSHNTVHWATLGGDFAVAASSTVIMSVPSQDYVFPTTPAFVADVQSMLDSPGGNHGWALLGNEEEAHTAKRLNSRENLTAGTRPRLTIDYTVAAPAVGPAGLIGMGVLLTGIAGLAVARRGRPSPDGFHTTA